MNSVDEIKNAIENFNVITFNYDGYTRRIEPHHYDILNGKSQLHGYQVSNGSKSLKTTGWRNFKLHGIHGLSTDHSSTFSQRDGYNQSSSNYSRIIQSIRSNPLPRP